MAIPTNIQTLLSGEVVEWARIEFKKTGTQRHPSRPFALSPTILTTGAAAIWLLASATNRAALNLRRAFRRSAWTAI